MLDQLLIYFLAIIQIQAQAESKTITALYKARDIKIGTFRKALGVA
jgi:hypothetical protein